MRTRPLLGRKAWFGPRRKGWGLSPVSAEGWVVSLAAAIAAIALGTLGHRERWTAVLPVILLLVIVFLKGTAPGGQRRWEEFQASKDR
jgi:MFS-type transporter involved in bile tolerance (Atg22 family)